LGDFAGTDEDWHAIAAGNAESLFSLNRTHQL